MLPCAYKPKNHKGNQKPAEGNGGHHRRLLWYEHRMLGGGAAAVGCKEGFVPLISANDAAKFRLTHETSFVKGHSSFWTKNPILFALVCFLRQFYRTVRKTDYLALRHGFVSVHLAPGSKFDFQKYIKRSLEDDFKVVVGISPLLWASAVFFLLLNVDKWDSMVWLSFLPLIVILSVGMKLQAVITRMAVEITERHAVIQGMPLVQNAFEITYFLWIWYEFGLRSCFHSNFAMTIVRVCLGVAVQFMCCYITLPLYALVTQMGSTMKRSIFDAQTSKALTKWRKNAKKKNDGKPGPVPTQVLGGSPKHNEMADMTTVDLQGEDRPDHDHP
uniref:MLO-like protein n=1 Tax=Chenopodium quinoa TaxID=63459 RepID=A0A803M6N6_CHEQI